MAAAARLHRERSRSPRLAAHAFSAPERQRRLGRVRWYSGRRQVGIVDCDDGSEFFVPVLGAANQNLVPATPGGLVHGTRVSFVALPLGASKSSSSSAQAAAVDVRPVEGLPQKGLECGVHTDIGGRATNEDRLVANDLYDLGFLAGVFDGHGGTSCVDYVSQRVPVLVHAAYTSRAQRLKDGIGSLTPGQEEDLITDAMMEAFAQSDAEFMAAARRDGLRDGSTGLVALLAHGFEALPTLETVPGCPGGVAKLFVANCGDCRAVLVRGRKAIALTEDHKPERQDETERIQKAGGIVIHCTNTGIHRVGRKKGENRCFLSTSRSFGDAELKEPRPLVIAEPEVKVHTLVSNDWCAILACDGIWNTMSDQDAADAVWQVMFRGGTTIEAAQEVAARAQERGSTDNVTLVVMRFGWATPPARMM